MVNPVKINSKLNQQMVMGVILTMVIFTLFGCGQEENASSNYEIPETYTHQPAGKALGISPKSFIDTLNGGAVGNVFFLKSEAPDDPMNAVMVPGMVTADVFTLTQTLEALKSRETIFIISLYGSDARKLAQMNISLGLRIYYVVGGSYKLAELIRQQHLVILPRPEIKKKSN